MKAEFEKTESEKMPCWRKWGVFALTATWVAMSFLAGGVGTFLVMIFLLYQMHWVRVPVEARETILYGMMWIGAAAATVISFKWRRSGELISNVLVAGVLGVVVGNVVKFWSFYHAETVDWTNWFFTGLVWSSWGVVALIGGLCGRIANRMQGGNKSEKNVGGPVSDPSAAYPL